VPLTTSPRYVRSDEANSRHADGQPLALLRDPGHRFSLDLRFPDGGSASSPTHALAKETEDGEMRVRLKDGEVLPDRDCVLKWKPPFDVQHPALNVHFYDDGDEKSVYFLALITPPYERVKMPVARESILLVDHSGSMSGPKWEAADWAVKQFLNGLTGHDSFALGLFHNSTKWFADRPRTADEGTVKAAIQFLEKNRDSGGTELGVALEQALEQKRRSGEISRHVLILTDAEVSDSGRILRLAERESARADRRRVSVRCIDAAPNSFLARELAERGGGTATFLTSEPEQEDITTALDRILEDWSAPVFTGLRLEVNRSGAQAVGRECRATSREGGSVIDIGDLPAGRAVWVAGRVPRGDSADLSFRLIASDGREMAGRRYDIDGKQAGKGVKALFGASRVLALEFLTTAYYDDAQIQAQLDRLGYDPKELDKKCDSAPLYAENLQKNAREGLKPLLVREALRYGLASSETAFIAVRKEAGNLVQETHVVANALPSGWSGDFLSAGAPMAPMQASYAPMPTSAKMLRAYMKSAAPSGPPPPSPVAASMPFDYSTPGDAPPQPPTAKARGITLGELGSGLANAAGGIVDAARNMLNKGASQRMAESSDEDALFSLEAEADVPAFLRHRDDTLFAGVPTFSGKEAVLFDTTRDEDGAEMQGSRTFSKLVFRFTGGAPNADNLDTGLTVLIFVDDMVSPRAQVRLVDLLKQGGVRPLNIRRTGSQVVRIVLVDPNGVWASGAPPMEVSLT
jgi:Ca-activated chloride channel family protein